MRIFTSKYSTEEPFDADELVGKLFGDARQILRTARNHRPTVVTLFKSAAGYVAHRHVIVADEGDEGKDVPSIKPIIDKEWPDAFAMISLIKAKVTGNKKGHPEGQSLFLVFHSNSENRMLYQTFTVAPDKNKGALPVVKMGKLFKTDKAIDLLGFGDLGSYKLERLPYLG